MKKEKLELPKKLVEEITSMAEMLGTSITEYIATRCNSGTYPIQKRLYCISYKEHHKGGVFWKSDLIKGCNSIEEAIATFCLINDVDSKCITNISVEL